MHTRACAASAVVTTSEIERVWIAYAPSPERRTPGNPPSHSPAKGWYDVERGGAVYASPRPYPATMSRASHAARSRTTQVSDVTAAGQGASSGLVGPAPPVVDLVDRVGFPSLNQRAQPERREKPQDVHRTRGEV